MSRPVQIAIAAALLSIIISLWLVPTFVYPDGLNRDPDRYGELGRNLAAGKGMLYDRSSFPATDRGPGYPAFLALTFLLTGTSSVIVVQLAQALLHGASSLLVYDSVRRITDRRAALKAQVVFAMFPPLLWYAGRIWAETLLVFLTVLTVWLMIRSAEQPVGKRLIPLGIGIGSLILTKSVFLLFPLLLGVVWYADWKLRGLMKAGLVLAITAIFVLPWTARNYSILRQIVPVHTTLGINLLEGNVLASDIARAPLSSAPHWYKGAALADSIAAGWHEPESSYEADRTLTAAALREIAGQPLFLLKRTVVNLMGLFTLGESPWKTIGFMLLQVPLGLLALRGLWRGWGDRRIRLVGLLFLYYIAIHAVVYGTARFSAPLVPVMVLLAIAGVYIPVKTSSIQEPLP